MLFTLSSFAVAITLISSTLLSTLAVYEVFSLLKASFNKASFIDNDFSELSLDAFLVITTTYVFTSLFSAVTFMLHVFVPVCNVYKPAPSTVAVSSSGVALIIISSTSLSTVDV